MAAVRGSAPVHRASSNGWFTYSTITHLERKEHMIWIKASCEDMEPKHVTSSGVFFPLPREPWKHIPRIEGSLENCHRFKRSQKGGDMTVKILGGYQGSYLLKKTLGLWYLNKTWLVVSTHLKDISRNDWIFPNFRGENEKYMSCHHLVMVYSHKLDVKYFNWMLQTLTSRKIDQSSSSNFIVTIKAPVRFQYRDTPT